MKIFLKKKRQKAKKTNGEKRFEIDMKIFLKKKKKSGRIIVNVIRIFLMNKSKSKLSI